MYLSITVPDENKFDHSPVLIENTPMYMDWISFIVSGITQR